METAAAPGLADLVRGFFRIGLTGFGGVGPIARDVIVERRRWMDEGEYARLVGVCQVLPGANTINVAVMIGDRYCGPVGALACVLALMAAPLALLVVLATVYASFADQPWIRTALTGAAASAAGLVIGTAGRLLARVRPDRRQLVTAGAAVALVLAGLSLPVTLLCLGPAAFLSRLPWRRRR